MRKQIIGLIAATVLMGTAGCSNENIGSGDAGSEEELLVSFSIGTPETDEVIYTRAETEAEKMINSLRVYDFLVNGGKTVISTVHRLRKVEGSPKAGEFRSEYDAASRSMTATLTLSIRGTWDASIDPYHMFALVANEGEVHFDSIMRPGVTPIDSLMYSFSARRMKDGENCDKLAGSEGFVMTAVTGAMQIKKNMGLQELPKLGRMVARIDVAHNMLDTRNLKIVSVSAVNCAAQGYLFGQDSDGNATTDKYNYKSTISIGQNSTVKNTLEGLTNGGDLRKRAVSA